MPKTTRAVRQAKRKSPAPPAATIDRGSWPTAAAALAVFAVLFISLETFSYTQTSATWDEPIHLTDGYVAAAGGDFRVDPEHPHLLRIWAALPLLAMRGVSLDTGEIDRTEPNQWAFGTVFDFSHSFTYKTNDADRLLYAARFMIVVLGVVLGAVIFLAVREWFGIVAALLALLFYTFEPNLLAHASLVTTDFGLALSIFTAVYFLWRAGHRPNVQNVAGAVLSVVVALASKYSALILGPIIVVLLAISVLVTRTIRFRTALAIALLLAGGAYVGIWAVHGFRYAPGGTSAWLYHFHDNRVVQQRVPFLTAVVSWIDRHHLLPNVYSQGFLLSQAKAQQRGAFLAGSQTTQGWWYYFPLAFLMKTPVAAILLAVFGILVCVKRRWPADQDRGTFLLVPPAVYMGFAIQSSMNIGLRHILPVYPFVVVLAALGAERLIRWRGRTGRVVVAFLVVFWIAEFARAYPDPLTFFNTAVGGPANGYRYLVDSNLDWGQDLKRLKSWMDGKRVSHISLAYFGSADPAYYGIDCTYLPPPPAFVPNSAMKDPVLPGYVAVSATNLNGVYLNKDLYAPLREREPVARIGNSIFVYWVDQPWW